MIPDCSLSVIIYVTHFSWARTWNAFKVLRKTRQAQKQRRRVLEWSKTLQKNLEIAWKTYLWVALMCKRTLVMDAFYCACLFVSVWLGESCHWILQKLYINQKQRYAYERKASQTTVDLRRYFERRDLWPYMKLDWRRVEPKRSMFYSRGGKLCPFRARKAARV